MDDDDRCTATLRVARADGTTTFLRCTKPEGHEHPLAPHNFDMTAVPPMRSGETLTITSTMDISDD